MPKSQGKKYSAKSHRKKKPYERYTVRLWSIINMENALELYLTTNATLEEAAEEFEVPVSTLHTRVQGHKICPKMGPPTVLSEEEERKLHEFLLEGWFLRVPRTKDLLAIDIKFMLDCQGRVTKFTNNKPGDWWFDRFGKLGPYDAMIFPSQSEVEDYKMDISNLKDWATSSKQFILNSEDELFTYTKQVYFIESQTLMPNGDDKERVDIIATYTAAGEFHTPTVVHDGYILQSDQQFSSKYLRFMQTQSGGINFGVIDNLIADMVKYAETVQTPFPIAIYLDAVLSKQFTYKTWKFCKRNMVIIQCIPPKISQLYKDLSLGAMHHIYGKWRDLWFQRFGSLKKNCKGLNVVTMLMQVLSNLKLGPTLRQTLRCLNLQCIMEKRLPKRKLVVTKQPTNQDGQRSDGEESRTMEVDEEPQVSDAVENEESMTEVIDNQQEVHYSLQHDQILSEVLQGYDNRADKATQTYFKSEKTAAQVLSVMAVEKPFKTEPQW